jgi:alpha-L-rhamnosidase
MIGTLQLVAFLAIQQTSLGVTGLRVEYLANPLGIDAAKPRLSWRITSTERNTMQAAYQIQVTRDGKVIWDSGRTTSDASVFVPYGGPAMESRARYVWRVRVWDAKGRASPWGEGWWETGLLAPSDWSASWIGTAPSPSDSISSPAPMLRRGFRVGGTIQQARIYATSLGVYELQLNGRRVGDQLFTPGWTSYNKRLQYQTYDVTSLLRAGENVVGAILGDGWYRGNLGFDGQRNVYGTRLALRLQLEIRYRDGHVERVVSDTQWKTATGPILLSDIYGGETYDARRERPGWAGAGYDDRDWTAVVALDPPSSQLLAPQSPPVRRVRELRPIGIRRTGDETIFDLGQNFTGWARLKVRGQAGTTVTLRFAEVLNRDGTLYTDNLRRASQTDRYTLKGGAEEIYEPHFTFHGFRYVGVRGLPGAPDTATITGIALSSDLAQTGSFETSDSLLNRLQQNIVWGQRSNFLDVPTDCPQRDERLGWTGDAQVFASTAAFNMDVSGFFAKWLGDAAADQHPGGSVTWVIPNVLGGDSTNGAGTAGWSDAAVVVPWTMYVAYGDRGLLERQYPSMRAWVEYERRQAGPDFIWQPGWQFGDWLALHSDDPSYPGATTLTDFIATAHLAHSADLVARAARALGKTDDAALFEKLFQDVRTAFNREFVSASGRVGENTQTAYALAIGFNLLPDSLVPAASERLAAAIRYRGMHLTTGFLGTPQLLPVLSATRHFDVAYALLMQKSYPSWLYPITRGATTMWERWDGIKPDSTFQDAGMNSFNHYAFGAVGSWMYRTIGGIELDPAAPGGKRVRIAPRPGAGLTYARTSLETPYGTVVSSWKLDGQRFVLDVTVPPNTTAEIKLPDSSDVVTVGSGTYHFASSI